MSYELFKQGPAAYVPVLLISLLITLVAYGAFPLIFARTRKAVISRKKYNLICFGFNFLVLILFIVLNGSSSAGPYALWTWVFSASGLRTLEERGVHAMGQVVNFFTDGTIPLDRLPRAVNSILPPDIVVLDAAEADRDFSARHSAKSKIYIYRICLFCCYLVK